jgi:Lrp/AsnC family transcriptional regulator, leucine-responsive regulatory protein
MDHLDPTSRTLLQELQRDSRQSIAQLAEKAKLSATPCWKRIKDMETSGVIRGYSAQINRQKVGLTLCVIAEVNLSRHQSEDVTRFEQTVAVCPWIVSCYSTTGQADYIIKVLAEDIEHYERLLHSTIFKLPGVSHVRSSVVLKEIKHETSLPV